MPPSSDFKQVKMETKSRTFLFGKIFNQRSNNFQESCAKLDQLWGHISKAVYLSTGHLWGSGSKFQLSKVTSDYSKATKLKKKFDIFPEYPPPLVKDIYWRGERCSLTCTIFTWSDFHKFTNTHSHSGSAW